MIFEFIFLFKLESKIAIEFLSIGGRLGKAGKVGDLSFIYRAKFPLRSNFAQRGD
jgi:hypothetical protein